MLDSSPNRVIQSAPSFSRPTRPHELEVESRAGYRQLGCAVACGSNEAGWALGQLLAAAGAAPQYPRSPPASTLGHSFLLTIPRAMTLVWLRYLAAAVLSYFALSELWLLRVYAGRAPIHGQYMAPNPNLRATAIKTLVGALIAIPIVLRVEWPAVVTWLLCLHVLLSLLDLSRCIRAVPPYTEFAAGGAFDTHHRRQVRAKGIGILVAVVLACGSAVVLGV